MLTCCRAFVLAGSKDSASEGWRSPLRYVLAVAIVAGSVAVKAQSAPTPPPTGRISGMVLDVSGQPIADVAVTMSTIGARSAGAAADTTHAVGGPVISQEPLRTDSLGRFAIMSLPSGSYTLRVRQEGYAHVRGATVVLKEGEAVTGLVLRAGKRGSVAGTVRDDKGGPIVGAGIVAFNRRMLGFRAMLVPGGSATTDDGGQFRVADLPPGDYLICACKVDSPRAAKGAMVFAPTFYPGSTSVANAFSIDVAYSDDRSGMDITVTPVRPSRVSGKLTGGGPDLSTTHNLTMLLQDDDAAAMALSEEVPRVFLADGSFEFVGVTPGRYILEAFPAAGKGLRSSQTVIVSDRDVTGLEMTLGPGATVLGRLEFSGRAARPAADKLEKSTVGLVPILLTPTQLMAIGQSGSPSYLGKVSRDGIFAIENLPPGQYMVVANVPMSSWQTVESVSSLAGRSLDPLVDVPPSGDEAVVVTMSDALMATLEARIDLAEHEMASEVRVAVFPVDRTYWDQIYKAPARFVVTTVTRLGTVAFPNLPAGDYHVLELAPEAGMMSPERMAEWAKRATTVRLRAGAKTSVTLKR